MKKTIILIFAGVFLLLYACSGGAKETIVPDVADFRGLNEYQQETGTGYRLFFKPEGTDGYVGDVMPYYENGVFHLFYLKDEGGSLRHSVYRVDTTDFIHYTDKGLVLESGFSQQQDFWIGTGSVVKADDDYYFFYTGHNYNRDPWEKVLLAKSEGNMENFQKVAGFEIAPPSQYSQVDFRDPQVFYDETSGVFNLSVETNASGVAHLVKYTVSKDLQTITHDGIFYSDYTYGFWNMECMDIVNWNNKYFLTYSGQNDTCWYTVSDSMFSGYGTPERLEGKIFYAPKTVSDGKDVYLVGWAARRRDFLDTSDLYWGGHLVAHKMVFDGDDVTLAPVNGLESYFGYDNKVNESYSFTEGINATKNIAQAAESFMISGKFRYFKEGDFGIVLGDTSFRRIGYSGGQKALQFTVPGNYEAAAEFACTLGADKEYSFKFIMEGSVGIFYIDGFAALSVRIYGANNEKIGFYSDENAVVFSDVKMFLRSKTVAKT